MPTPEQLAVQLARAFALTEIFPLRHSNVQEALEDFAQASSTQGLSLELRDDELWVDGFRVVDDSPDVRDLQKGFARCGVNKVRIAEGLESRVIGAFLDTVRIASISGHRDNLQELGAYYQPALEIEFEDPREVPSELAQPAGAIFAAAMTQASPGGGTVDGDHGAEERTEALHAQEAEVDEVDEVDEQRPPERTLVEARESWDPPGSEGIDQAGAPTATDSEPSRAATRGAPADEPPVQESAPPVPRALPATEFRKGVELFLGGSPTQRRAWGSALVEQARRVDTDADPETALDIVVMILGETVADAEPEVLSVGRELMAPTVARALALRLGQAADEDARGVLLQVARHLGDLTAPAFAEELASSTDRAARRALVHALTSLGDSALETVEAMADDPRWYVVRNAVTVLGAIGSPSTMMRLEPCLRHSDARVRRETIMALAKLGGDKSGELVLDALVDRDSDVRAAATMVAGVLKVTEAAPILRERAEVEENEGVLIETLRTLGQLKDEESVPLLKKRAVLSFFSRPARPVRIAAFRALGSIGTPEALRLLEEATDDRDPDVRNVARQAVESLA